MTEIDLSLPARVLDILYKEAEKHEGTGFSEDAAVQAAWDDLGPVLTAAILQKGTRRNGPPVKVRVTAGQLVAVRHALQGVLPSVHHSTALEPVQLVMKRIDHHREHGEWPAWTAETGVSLHRPEIRAEAERVVKEAIRHCVRVARRKDAELSLPSDWKPSLKVSWHVRRRASHGGKSRRRGLYGGHGGVSLALAFYVPVDGTGGGTFTEYAHVAKEPVIGSFTTGDWRNVVRALVCHEVAHTLQGWLDRHGRGVHRRIDYETPHGEGWKKLYAMLRHAVVNPLLKAERTAAQEMQGA